MPRSPSRKAANNTQSLEEAVSELSGDVRQLSREVEVLRIAIDDLRQEVEWAIRNLPKEPRIPTLPLTSVPKDPCASDFGKRVNTATRDDIAAAAAASADTGQESAQGLLWKA